MATRRLYNMFKQFASDPTFARNDSFLPPETAVFALDSTFATAGTFLDKGIVLAVFATAGAMITFRGQTVRASQSTQEPLRVGQEVWVTKAISGEYVISGTVR